MRKMLFENLGLKISAVVLSIFLWLFVTLRGQSEISLEVPLQFKNVPAGLELVDHSAKTVEVNIKGQERVMKNVRPSDVTVLVDLSRAKKGEFTATIGRDDVKLPYAMSVENIAPSLLKLRLEETASKSVPVRPTIIGSPPAGFFVRDVEAEPQSVIIRGLKTEVSRLSEVRTEPIDVSDATGTITQESEIDTRGGRIKTSTDTVMVKVVIGGRKR